MTDCDEDAVHLDFFGFTGSRAAKPEAGNAHLIAEHFIHFTLQMKDDLSFLHGFHNPGDLN